MTNERSEKMNEYYCAEIYHYDGPGGLLTKAFWNDDYTDHWVEYTGHHGLTRSDKGLWFRGTKDHVVNSAKIGYKVIISKVQIPND